ncbi:DUF541 domain-containing protein [Hahella sp. KA22]|uniref:SIMPL domain-containing protein n=1 Tax=Hahella sp. KA22 TaxID=1628392 RepID=UPI000FDE254D|nr:SIMPL domain-containing protein [Hahella sp. KA22]AZZ90056.1 DUF541 domain-containing protein [Hahella sp. KA22]QAY53426.1 DUF541 domain-containing protein [Hahella sp. KA22]
MSISRFLVLSVLAMPAFAAEQTNYDRVQLSTEAKGELENDIMRVVLHSQSQQKTAQQAADDVNKAMRWALDEVKSAKSVKYQTQDYRTDPRYKEQKIVAWNAEQSLKLESKDIEALSGLIGELQERLKVQNVEFDASDALKASKENELIGEALKSFGERAKLITSQLGAQSYKIVNMNISSSGPVYYARQEMRSFGAAKMAEMATPAVAAGTQTVTMTVNGEIELVR